MPLPKQRDNNRFPSLRENECFPSQFGSTTYTCAGLVDRQLLTTHPQFLPSFDPVGSIDTPKHRHREFSLQPRLDGGYNILAAQLQHPTG